MTWWLSCSAAELDAARTCRNCGCKDADIDIGLCFECFCREREPDPRIEPPEDPRIAEYEAEMDRIANAAVEARRDAVASDGLLAGESKG